MTRKYRLERTAFIGCRNTSYIDFSRDHIKVLDHQGTYVSVPCTYLDIK